MIYSMSFVWNRSVHARYYLIQQKTNTYSKLFSWFPQDYSHLDVKSLILLFNSRSELHFDGLSSFYLLIWTSTKVKDLRALVLREVGKGGSCSIKLTCIWIYREHQLQPCEAEIGTKARIYNEVLDLYVIPFMSVDKHNYNSNSNKKLMDLVTSVFLLCIFDDIFSLFCCLCFLFFCFQPTFFPLDLFSLFFLHWLIPFCFLGFFFLLLW